MKKPNRFIGLHAHDGKSTFDGLGTPAQHIEFVLENGMDAWAETNHGHMNGFAESYLFVKKLKTKGVNFKFIPGCELYVHPDLDQWRRDKETSDAAKQDARESKKLTKKQREDVLTDIVRTTDADDETLDVEMTNALTIENEEETKSNKSFNPTNRRHHLVVLPKTSAALKRIFRLVSRGYLEGFYRFPRVDMKMLKEAAGGEKDILISSACMGGELAYAVFSQLRHVPFDALGPNVLDDPAILSRVLADVETTFDRYADAVGPKNVLIELQFNKFGAQDLVNRALLELAKKNGMTDQLVVTADSHYPRPELWKHREMYKKLGWMNYSSYGPESLPKSVEDLKCELYPKNAGQVWDEYERSKERSPGTYAGADQLVFDAIERTHSIAHDVIGDITLDTTYSYPSSTVPKGMTPFKRLCELCKEGMVKRGLSDRPEYLERMKHELVVIKELDNAAYFVTLALAMDLARGTCLVGCARGSSGGSLVAYAIGITYLDPIKYECRFDRFMSRTRVGAPDIDVDVGDRDKVLDVLRKEFGFNNVIPISNVNTFKVKTLVKDLSKFHGIPFEEANAATRTVEQEVRRATLKVGSDKNLFTLTFADAMLYNSIFISFVERHPEIEESINIIFKEQRALSRHAGGVCILDDATGQMPLITSKGEPQTPWVEGVGGKFLEPLGVIKYDILGLEAMRLIQRSIELLLKKRGLFEVLIGDEVHRLSGDVGVTMNDGSKKLVKDLIEGDDIVNA